MSAEIIAVQVPMGDKDFSSTTFAQLQIVAFQPMSGNPGAGVISSSLASDKEVDDTVAYLIKEVEKAGRAAKKILRDSKGDKI
jgi:hypothetical protein